MRKYIRPTITAPRNRRMHIEDDSNRPLCAVVLRLPLAFDHVPKGHYVCEKCESYAGRHTSWWQLYGNQEGK